MQTGQPRGNDYSEMSRLTELLRGIARDLSTIQQNASERPGGDGRARRTSPLRVFDKVSASNGQSLEIKQMLQQLRQNDQRIKDS